MNFENKMMMKKIFIYMAFLLLASACTQMDDIYDDLDASEAPYSKEITYTLVSDDYKTISNAALADAKTAMDTMYAESVTKDEAFNDSVTASDYLGEVLIANFVALGQGSVASVTYNTTVKPAELLAYESAQEYKLSDADYDSIGDIVAEHGTFFPSKSPSSFLPGVLSEVLPTAQAGDMAAVTYNYSEIEPAVVVEGTVDTLSTDDFDADLGLFTIEKVVGETAWEHSVYNASGYAKVNTYGKGSNESWLISPAISLDVANHISFEVASYNSDKTIGSAGAGQFEVYYSTSYNGTFDASQWTRVTSVDNVMLAARWEFTAVDFSLASLTGSTAYIAFRHKCDDASGTTWEVDNISLISMPVSTSGASSDLPIEEINALYAFDGSGWSVHEDAIILNPAEYDAMGAPGKYNNFSSSDKPEDYLPTYLALKNPYAQDGESYTLVYSYYGGNNALGADIYTYSDGVWASPSTALKISETSPFYNSENGWILDPTIRFSIAGSEYQAAVDWVKDNMENGDSLIDSYGNTEYYYGFASYYSNIDLRLSKRSDYNVPLTQAEMDEHGISTWTEDTDKSVLITFNRIKNEGIPLILSLKYPDAQSTVFGVEQTYEVTFVTYENDLAKNWYTYKFSCTKSAPSPEFTFVEEIAQ